MKKKKNFLDIIYWTLVLGITVTNIVNGFKSGSFNVSGISFEMLNFQFFLILTGSVLLFTVINFIIAVFKIFPITILYIGIKIARRKFNKERLDKVDFTKNVDYFRDIIKQYSPGVLNYIDNFTIDRNTIIATLMSLQLKGKIDNELSIINEDITDLDENEKFIYNNISNLNKVDLHEFEKIIMKDCKKYNLLAEKKHKTLEVELRGIFAVIAIIIINNILPNAINSNFWITAILMLIEVGAIIAMPILIVRFIAYVLMQSESPYIRSNKAKELNENLEGLKKYLEDYSMIQERTEKELAVWEDYLIYSVIFNQNSNLIEEYENKIS